MRKFLEKLWDDAIIGIFSIGFVIICLVTILIVSLASYFFTSYLLKLILN